jgi:hypothetical protein
MRVSERERERRSGKREYLCVPLQFGYGLKLTCQGNTLTLLLTSSSSTSIHGSGPEEAEGEEEGPDSAASRGA